MGKAGKWLKSLLAGKKEDKAKKEKERQKEQDEKERETRSALISVPSSKEKRRWSFRRSGGAAGKDSSFSEPLVSTTSHGMLEAEMDQKRHVMAVAAATAAAAEAAIAAAQAAATVIRLTTKATESSSSIEETAAIQIQAAFRGYLARKALCGLKGCIKLQALVRGHLVRKQATTTLRYMQALVTAQERARVQRIRMLEAAQPNSKRQPSHRQSPQHPRQSFDLGRTTVENVKIVEMDHGDPRSSSKSRKSYSVAPTERLNHRLSSYSSPCATPKVHAHHQVSPSPSALTDMSARACSGHFKEFSFTTAQSSPRYLSSASMPVTRKTSFTLPQQDGAHSMSNDYLFIPSYMANTESSRARSRSQSAPKQRPDNFERPSSRRRQTMEGRNTPRSGRMQGSSSHLSAIAQGYQYPWSIKLDKSSMSFKGSECGSTSTVLTNTNYYSSLEAYEVYGCG